MSFDGGLRRERSGAAPGAGRAPRPFCRRPFRRAGVGDFRRNAQRYARQAGVRRRPPFRCGIFPYLDRHAWQAELLQADVGAGLRTRRYGARPFRIRRRREDGRTVFSRPYQSDGPLGARDPSSVYSPQCGRAGRQCLDSVGDMFGLAGQRPGRGAGPGVLRRHSARRRLGGFADPGVCCLRSPSCRGIRV